MSGPESNLSQQEDELEVLGSIYSDEDLTVHGDSSLDVRIRAGEDTKGRVLVRETQQ